MIEAGGGLSLALGMALPGPMEGRDGSQAAPTGPEN